MQARRSGWGLCLIVLAVGCSGGNGGGESPTPAASPEETVETSVRNPFGVPDVPDCCGPDVQEFAETAPLLGEADDENAPAWGRVSAPSDLETIDGEWSGRWNSAGRGWQTGTATVRTVGDRVYVLYKDAHDYLIEAERKGQKLVGRYVNLGRIDDDSSPWVGNIIGYDRIDGVWAHGRWDLRRVPDTGSAADPGDS